MAVLPRHVARSYELLVVEARVPDLDVPFRGGVAVCASPDRVLDAPDLGSLEVTQEAGALGDFHVVPHDDLAVTTRAPELLPSLEVHQVRPVVELDPALERDLSLEEPGFVASHPQAGGVVDLGVRLGAVGAGHVLWDLRERLA